MNSAQEERLIAALEQIARAFSEIAMKIPYGGAGGGYPSYPISTSGGAYSGKHD